LPAGCTIVSTVTWVAALTLVALNDLARNRASVTVPSIAV
jgi:hypothetical protein